MSWMRVVPVAVMGMAVPLCWSACGDDGGEDGGDGKVDGGGGPDGSVGPGEPAEGQFAILESEFGGSSFPNGTVSGSIFDPRPVYHELVQSAGACQMWTYEVGNCGSCDGLCNAEGDCIPFPVELSAGTVRVDGLSEQVVLRFEEYGYYPDGALPSDLFAAGDLVTLRADGGEDVEEFSLTARGVEPIAIDLEQGGEKGEDTLRLEDGADLIVAWSPAEPGTRVRLDLLSDNRGHGLPVDAMIQCEADDSGRIVVPRAMIEAFPGKPYANICAGSDCPPSTLTRFRSDRAEVGGRAIELTVGSQLQFILVHDAG
jgi:hypothetical protein